MNKFNFYLEKARDLNNESREISEEEKLKIADEILENEEDVSEEESCEEKDLNESLSIKSRVKLILESKDETEEKAKKIKKAFLETGIDQKVIIEKLSNSFNINDEVKEELLKYYI